MSKDFIDYDEALQPLIQKVTELKSVHQNFMQQTLAFIQANNQADANTNKQRKKSDARMDFVHGFLTGAALTLMTGMFVENADMVKAGGITTGLAATLFVGAIGLDDLEEKKLKKQNALYFSAKTPA